MPTISLPAFIAKWQRSTLNERRGAQSHFIDLCHLLGQPTPTEADPTGDSFCFEKGVKKSGGGDGFADVWKRDCFAWEYKGKHKNLDAAYRQLQLYRDDLENPPLLVVCDFNRFEIHTDFNATPHRVYRFNLADMGSGSPVPGSQLSPIEMLRAVFTSPDRLRPDRTTSQVTEEVAKQFALLSESLRKYGSQPEPAARFLMKLLFCLFAQDVGLLPAHVFTRLVEATRAKSTDFTLRLRRLFEAMSTGGSFGEHDIPYFNGGLFSDAEAINLASDDMYLLGRVCKVDWAGVEPAIFGTLFERSLDPDKRSQTGSHYTSREDIIEIVEPVLMAPLRREWVEVRTKAATRLEQADATSGEERQRMRDEASQPLHDFSRKLAAVRVLDPACGSGNFLYVALKQLLGLEKEAIVLATANGLEEWQPRVSPAQLHGIEINPYAHELAQIVIWIGYLQWMHDNGFPVEERPILRPLDSVLQMDAILAHDEAGRPVEPGWPEADVIVGNPPFLGGKMLRRGLGDGYVNDLFALYDGRVPREADLVCYWFERARALIEAGRIERAGLLATQGIRGGANRKVLQRIKESGDIFMAWSDRPWVLDGAAVHVSMVGFDAGSEESRQLDGGSVPSINADLTGSMDTTAALPLPQNAGLAFMGATKGGPFHLTHDQAASMLTAPLNPNGRPNSDVVRPWVTGIDLTQRPRGMWIVDFGTAMSEESAALYERPFEYVQAHVKRVRAQSRTTRSEWWLHERPRVEMRKALNQLPRYIGTSMVAKHRVFVWLPERTLPENLVIVIARDDDYFFGVLQSKIHELWASHTGTQLREAESGRRYTPTTTFETFPFPWAPKKEPAGDPRVEAIAGAARELVEKRDLWLNPEGATEAVLKERTLTNLYNRMPEWLRIAHRKLDEAVLDAYGWPRDLSDQDVLERLLALNHQRAAAQG